MSSKHTSGPWEVHLGYDNTGYPCFYIHGMSGDQKRDIPVLTANAKLITAAPELLESLAALLNVCDNGPITYMPGEKAARDAARAAIAKATGEA